MEAAALKRLEELAACAYLDINKIIENTATDNTPAAAIPKDVSIDSLERLLPHPRRFRGIFESNSRNAFLRYCGENSSEASGVFIDPAQMGAFAIFDLGTGDAPHWGTHRAKLAFEKKAAFDAVQKIQRSVHTQRDLVDWLENWGDHIAPIGQTGEDISMAAAIAAVRRVNLNTTKDIGSQVGDFNTKRSALEEVELSSKLELPAGFNFRCVPYPDFDERVLPCRLRANISGEKLTFSVRILALEEIEEAIAEEFRRALATAPELADATVHIGTMLYRA